MYLLYAVLLVPTNSIRRAEHNSLCTAYSQE
nr:MAG TPA: hypothetical protein [Caudoviricetes sp.]